MFKFFKRKKKYEAPKTDYTTHTLTYTYNAPKHLTQKRNKKGQFTK